MCIENEQQKHDKILSYFISYLLDFVIDSCCEIISQNENQFSRYVNSIRKLSYEISFLKLSNYFPRSFFLHTCDCNNINLIRNGRNIQILMRCMEYFCVPKMLVATIVEFLWPSLHWKGEQKHFALSIPWEPIKLLTIAFRTAIYQFSCE